MGLAVMTFSGAVLQIVPELDAGGAERTTVEIAAAIVAAGGRAIIATHGGRLVEEAERVGAVVHLLPVHSKNPVAIWRNGARLTELAQREAADIIHVRSRAPAWSALIAARRAQTALFSTYHGAYEAQSPLKRFYNSGLTRADVVIANSEFTGASICAQYPGRAERVIVIPRGADTDRFDPRRVDQSRLSALTTAWGSPPEQAGVCRILAPGRMTAWKGQEDAVEALAILAGNSSATPYRGNPRSGHRPKFELVFCGDFQGRRSYVESVERLIEARGVGAMVKIVGHCADMPAAYAWSDIVVAPSRRPEAFGRVAVEAGAMERPVIAANHGGARETIVDGATGRLTRPGDPKALAVAIADLAELPAQKRHAMGLAARDRVIKHYSTRAMCSATLAAYARSTSGN